LSAANFVSVKNSLIFSHRAGRKFSAENYSGDGKDLGRKKFVLFKTNFVFSLPPQVPSVWFPILFLW
jgi:hypothetical protein